MKFFSDRALEKLRTKVRKVPKLLKILCDVTYSDVKIRDTFAPETFVKNDYNERYCALKIFNDEIVCH